jgi:hypothetical protein
MGLTTTAGFVAVLLLAGLVIAAARRSSPGSRHLSETSHDGVHMFYGADSSGDSPSDCTQGSDAAGGSDCSSGDGGGGGGGGGD